MNHRTFSFALASVLAIGLTATTGISSHSLQDPSPQADNSKTNKTQSPTADDQKMNAADRELTRKIRAAIHQDKSLSTYGHNVKIITQNGKVTLKGPVRSEGEKSNIAAKAAAIAGKDNVDNQLEIAPSN